MGKLVKYLGPFVWYIVAVFVLLFGGAMADLSLPAYMSNIVNVGIQAGGIENAVPKAVPASEFNRLTLFSIKRRFPPPITPNTSKAIHCWPLRR